MIYLDHAATSPARPEAIAAMTAELGQAGNPSAIHAAGRRARSVIDDARETIGSAFGARPGEVIFTAGGTESDNLAVKGMYWARRAATPTRRRVLVPATEHHAVLDAVTWLVNHQGAVVTWLPVSEHGTVVVDAAKQLIAEHQHDTALVTLMWANNETGVVHAVEEIAQCAAQYGIPVHTDATQAAGKIPLDFACSAVTAMTISAHKMGGPVGAGALLLETGCVIEPVHHGGGQERKVRSGTLDPVTVAGFGAAVAAVHHDLTTESMRLAQLRDDFVQHVLATTTGVHLSGPPLVEGQRAITTWDRLPHIAHFTVENARGEALLFLLDQAGLCASSGSACSSGVQQPSHVLQAMNTPSQRVNGALRFSLGHTTTVAEIETAKTIVPDVIAAATRTTPPRTQQKVSTPAS